ncbi:MAG: glycoside hydrolase family 28 protein [Victivallaceae bacterium]|nr:glycoside hydrolase family 28 protein [Victivallaceae bacterium]
MIAGKRFYAPNYLAAGETPETDIFALRRAIHACADAGGGIVEVTPEIWHSGAIELASHVHLHLAKDAVIEFSPDRNCYFPEVFVRWEGIECFSTRPLVYARDAEDVAITGEGTLRGNGAAWRRFGAKPEHRRRAEVLRAMHSMPVEQRILNEEENFLRPSFVHFVNCRNVLWENFTIESGPMWTLHPVYCRNLVARGLTVRTAGPNTDGLNPDSCDGVLIEDCEFSTGDDCIAIKSGLDSDGWRVHRPCRNIRILRCKMTGGHAAVAFGSELSGGIENVEIRDCDVSHTGLGIRFKSLPGRGGFVRNVQVSDILMHDLRSSALHFDMDYAQTTLPSADRRGTVMENLSFDHVVCRNAEIGVFLKGHPAMTVRNLNFSALSIEAANPIVREGAPIDFTLPDE